METKSTVDAKSIFMPIEQDMPKVDAMLREVAAVEFPMLGELLRHILNLGGKRLRPALTLLAGKFHNYELDLLVPMATAMEVLHTATLVHDDMIDNAIIRRGNLTVNNIWNPGAAVLVGDYLFAKSADLVATTKNVRAMQLFAQTLMEICNGELRQLFTSGSVAQNREDYYRKIGSKTASLFATCLRSGAILSSAPENQVEALTAFGTKLGLAFQIIDDILDFVGEESELGKPVGNDLLQGTLTLPAILHMERYPDNNPVKRMFENSDRDAHARQAIEQIRNSEVIDLSYQIAAEFCRAAREALNPLPASESLGALMSLTDYVIARKH